MVTKISYYSFKNRIYVSITNRKTDAYFDIDSNSWCPKKIGKDDVLLEEIFKFANVKDLNEFSKIRTTYKETQEPELKKQRQQKKFIDKQLVKYDKYISYCSNAKYYYTNGFDVLDEIVESLAHFMDTNDMKEVSALSFYKKVKEFESKYYDWLKKTDTLTANQKEEIKGLLDELGKLPRYWDLKEDDECIRKNKKLKEVLNLFRDLVTKHKFVLLESVLIPKTINQIEEYRDYYSDYVKNAVERARSYIKDCGGIFVTSIRYKLNERLTIEKYLEDILKYNQDNLVLVYQEGINREYFKLCVKYLEIGKYDFDTNIDVDIEKAKEEGFNIYVSEMALSIDITEVSSINESEVIEVLKYSIMKFKSKNFCFYPTLLDGNIYVNRLNNIAREAIKLNLYRVEDIEDINFKEGYYIIKKGYRMNEDVEHFLLSGGQWYKLKYMYRKVIIRDKEIA